MVDGRWSRPYSRKLRLAFFTSASSRARVNTVLLLAYRSLLSAAISLFLAVHALPGGGKLRICRLPVFLCAPLDDKGGICHAYRQWWQWCGGVASRKRDHPCVGEPCTWPNLDRGVKRRCILLPSSPPLLSPSSSISSLLAKIQVFPVQESESNPFLRAATTSSSLCNHLTLR